MDIVLSLLQKIHTFYSIGLPQIDSVYPGKKLIEDKIESKINAISENIENAWTKLKSDIGIRFGNSNLLDKSFYQFPNYYLFVELEKANDRLTHFSRSIVVNISLLTDHYTVFLQDSFQFKDYDNNKYGINVLPVLDIVYYNSCSERSYLKFVEALKPMIEFRFPKHFFVEHSVLFNTRVKGGFTYGKSEEYDSEQEYSIYEYLFFSYLKREEIVVLD